MKTKTIELYQYDELSDAAKSRARDWWREASADDTFTAECVLDEFEEFAKALGWEIDRAKHGSGKAIYYSGFSSQGDGASFSGAWSAARCNPAAMLADRPLVYTDAAGKVQRCESNARLHNAAIPFQLLAGNLPSAYGHCTASSRYNNVSTEFETGIDRDDESHTLADWRDIDAADAVHADTFAEATRDLCHTLYRWLESEYEDSNSDERVAENIRCNEYDFDINGRRV